MQSKGDQKRCLYLLLWSINRSNTKIMYALLVNNDKNDGKIFIGILTVRERMQVESRIILMDEEQRIGNISPNISRVQNSLPHLASLKPPLLSLCSFMGLKLA